MIWKSVESKRLIQAILSLRTEDDSRRFLRDLMTEKEIKEFSKRLKAAEMLTEKVLYPKIEKETGLSSATIARVSRWLNGENGGYKRIINRLHHHDSTNLRRGLS